MRVLIAHSEYQCRGGEEQALVSDIQALEAVGETVRLVQISSKEFGNSVRDGLRAGARVFWSQAGYEAVQTAICEFRPDVMHFHNTFPNLGYSGWLAAKRHGIPVVQTLHNFRWLCAAGSLTRNDQPCYLCLTGGSGLPGVVHGCYRGSHTASAVLTAYGMISRVAAYRLDLVDRILVPSRFMARLLAEAGVPQDRMFVRPNISMPLPGSRDRLHAGNTILFVGRLSPEKGLEVLLRGWRAEFPTLVIAGGGDTIYIEKLHKLAKSASGRVSFVGSVERAQLATLFDDAVLLVVPSTCVENQPMVILEAFSRSVPVIGTRMGGIEELLAPMGQEFLCALGDPDDLARKLALLLGNPEALRNAGHKGRRLWVERFGPDAGAAVLLRHYHAVMRSGDLRM